MCGAGYFLRLWRCGLNPWEEESWEMFLKNQRLNNSGEMDHRKSHRGAFTHSLFNQFKRTTQVCYTTIRKSAGPPPHQGQPTLLMDLSRTGFPISFRMSKIHIYMSLRWHLVESRSDGVRPAEGYGENLLGSASASPDATWPDVLLTAHSTTQQACIWIYKARSTTSGVL